MFCHKFFFLFCIFTIFINLSRARSNQCRHDEVMGSNGKICYPCPASGHCNGGKSVICDDDKVFIKNNKGGKCLTKINSSSSQSSFEDMYTMMAKSDSSSEEIKSDENFGMTFE
ncbi:hypothetical protein PV327_010343 [Microctonus hyperodae]|uniref:Uncharacterized protein n=1 Tax=Microctonus hyperodae TaxID=165561 RepID=A0AA39FRQ2_MICHY|nr:hypothetical protein PV327_010343 [Microctonus hyperodae]